MTRNQIRAGFAAAYDARCAMRAGPAGIVIMSINGKRYFNFFLVVLEAARRRVQSGN
jgi:hypothetical protein